MMRETTSHIYHNRTLHLWDIELQDTGIKDGDVLYGMISEGVLLMSKNPWQGEHNFEIPAFSVVARGGLSFELQDEILRKVNIELGLNDVVKVITRPDKEAVLTIYNPLFAEAHQRAEVLITEYGMIPDEVMLQLILNRGPIFQKKVFQTLIDEAFGNDGEYYKISSD